MFAGVAGTHTALWFLFGDLRLSAAAKAFIEESASASRKIALPTISLAEIVYLVEKQRIPVGAFEEIVAAVRNPRHVFEEAPLTCEVAIAMQRIPSDAIPDMPDRIVAATAVFFGVPVLSRDARIGASSIQTIW